MPRCCPPILAFRDCAYAGICDPGLLHVCRRRFCSAMPTPCICRSTICAVCRKGKCMSDFEHRHAAHCESGTVASLLRHQGLDLSEPMVFGIGGGLFFLHLSFVKMGGIPLTSYRDAPRILIKNMEKRLGVRWHQQRYRSAESAMRSLDGFLAQGQPVGVRTGIYWLSYFARDMPFPFTV